MTIDSTPPREACLKIRPSPSALAVVALLLSVVAPAFAQAPATLPIAATNGGSVDSVVSKVNGPVLDVFDGALQIDVTNAKITGGDDRLASPVAWSGILVGSRIVAQVTVPDAIPAVFPPRLTATSVVVFLAGAGSLSGTVQAVDLAGGSFLLVFTSVKTTAATDWSGTKADGTPVKGLSDISRGMFATATVLANGGTVVATHVYAYAPPSSRIIAFRGKVVRIDGAIWTIGENVVQVNADTKIVGSPVVGDTVDVLEKVQVLPPGSMAPTTIPVAISITKVVNVPPPPTDRRIEFDGIVESIPATPTASILPPLGHWTISGRDVLVTAMTKLDTGIVKGSAVHVEGVTVPASVMAPSNAAAGQIVATSITKK